MTHAELTDLLMTSTAAMFAEGQPLMNRVLPTAEPAELWQHYPPDDVVNGAAGSRYFYHCHPPAERSEGEHGHFHLFLDTSVMPDGVDPIIAPLPATPDEPRADVVHIGALAISSEGLPLCWFTTNRWVSDEWIYPAEAVIDQLAKFDLRGPDGDPMVNDWLTAIVGLSRGDLAELLRQRDAVLEARDMSGEDRSVEITSIMPIALERLLGDEE
jgi:hypothetical protein